MPISQLAHREYCFPLPPPLGCGCPSGTVSSWCLSPSDALCPTSPRRVETIPSGELLQNHKGACGCASSHVALPTRRTMPSVGYSHSGHRPPVSRAGVPEQTCTGVRAASQSDTFCCSTSQRIFPPAQVAPCPGLAPQVTQVTRCWGAHGSSPCWKRFFHVLAQRHVTLPAVWALLSQPLARAPAVSVHTVTCSWDWGSTDGPSRAGNTAGRSASRPSA